MHFECVLSLQPPINADSEQELLDDLKDRPDGVYKSLVEAAYCIFLYLQLSIEISIPST